jgi:hypothetical protein
MPLVKHVKAQYKIYQFRMHNRKGVNISTCPPYTTTDAGARMQ